MPSETGGRGSTMSGRDREKELRRVYRKLKGVRSELSVKVRKLKKEVGGAEPDAEEADASSGERLDMDYHEDASQKDSGEIGSKSLGRSAIDGTQYEVKSLIDHKNRLRKRFWKLQEETRRKK